MSTRSSHLRLEVISGNAPGSTIIVEDELVIGRHATGAGRLSEDEEISRQHARISREVTGDYAIEDLGSSNGTFVNGLRIQSPRLLSLGDSIEAGATTLVVKEIVRPQPVETADTPPPGGILSAPTVFARVPITPEATPTSAQEREPIVEPSASTEPVEAVEAVEPARHAPPLEFKLEVDFDAREARITLGDGGEMVRMVFENGGWRTDTARPDPGS